MGVDSTVDAPARPLTLVGQLRRSAVMTWHELPRVIAACALWMLGTAPLVAAMITGLGWLIALSTVPWALATTGLARFAVRVWTGERAVVRDLLRVDALLALLLAVAVSLSGLALSTDGPAQVLGYALAALVAVVAPFALTYGAVRGRTGFGAIRGGAILVAYRPSAALTVLALGCIGAFAIAATVGALGVIVPCLLASFATAVVSGLLETIDSAEGGRRS